MEFQAVHIKELARASRSIYLEPVSTRSPVRAVIKMIAIIPTGDRAGCVPATAEQKVPVLRDQQKQLLGMGQEGFSKSEKEIDHAGQSKEDLLE